MRKEQVWNAILAAVGTALLAVIGWLALSVIQLQTRNAAEDAEEELRQDITDVMNDVDKRLAVIEALMRRDSPATTSPIPSFSVPNILGDDQGDDEDRPSEAAPQMPRYDLREQRSQRNNMNRQDR